MSIPNYDGIPVVNLNLVDFASESNLKNTPQSFKRKMSASSINRDHIKSG